MGQTFKKYSSYVCLASIIILLLVSFPFSLKAHAGINEVLDYDSILVKPRESALKVRRMSRLMRRNGILKYKQINEKVYEIPLDKRENKEERIAKLKNSGLFDLVEPNYELELDGFESDRNYVNINIRNEKEESLESALEEAEEITPNDKDFLSQYYLREINATKAWSTTVGDSLLVGVLDTGVDLSHPDLVGKVYEAASTHDVTDNIGHGTGVAGIIAANTNNNEGIAGIAWNTKIVPIRVTDENGQAKVSTVVAALDDAYAKGVKIVQISLSTSQFSQVLKDAVQQALDRNILIISTGGNTGVRELRYPSAFEGVIGVGAVNDSKQLELYSTTGNHISLVAPGSHIHTTSLNSGYAAVSGTSFAAPQVAGTAALIWSLAPNLKNDEVSNILMETAEDLGEEGKDHVYGYGLLNTQKAVELAKTKQQKEKIENEELEIEKTWITR